MSSSSRNRPTEASLMIPNGGSRTRSKNSNPNTNIDTSVLRPNLNVSVTGMSQAVKVLENGSPELRNYLLHECNLIYECRVCFNMFRSVANFTAHKRSFCSQKLKNVKHVNRREPDEYPDSVDDMATAFVQPEPVETVLSEKPFNLEEYSPSLELLKEAGLVQEIETRNLCSSLMPPTEKKPSLKGIVEKLRMKATNGLEAKYFQSKYDDIHSVRLEGIKQTDQAVFQTFGNLDTLTMGQKYVELEQLKQKYPVFIGPDGRVINPGLPPKSLNPFKSVTALSSSNTLYPCPLCTKEFSQISNVGRHCQRYHKKSTDEASDLKEKSKKMAIQKNQEAVLGNIRFGTTSEDDQHYPCSKCPQVLKGQKAILLHDISHNLAINLPRLHLKKIIQIPEQQEEEVDQGISITPEPLVKLTKLEDMKELLEKDTKIAKKDDAKEVIDITYEVEKVNEVVEEIKTKSKLVPTPKTLIQPTLSSFFTSKSKPRQKNILEVDEGDDDDEAEITFKSCSEEAGKDSGISNEVSDSDDDDSSIENHPSSSNKSKSKRKNKIEEKEKPKMGPKKRKILTDHPDKKSNSNVKSGSVRKTETPDKQKPDENVGPSPSKILKPSFSQTNKSKRGKKQ